MTGVSFVVSNFFSYLSPFFERVPAKLVPFQIEKVVTLVSRTGRDLQRYEQGCRLVVGCLPYRYKNKEQSSSIYTTIDEEIEVLMVSAQKGKGMLFPKGGWEIDETMEEAALRETVEEAGVTGQLEDKLGKWQYKSKRHGILHEGHMFPLLVNQQFDHWPEAEIRERKWVTLAEAGEACQNWWMKEALDQFINRKREI